MVIVKRSAGGAAAGSLVCIVVLLVALAPFWLPLPLPTLFLTAPLAVPARVIVAGPLLRAFQVRPAWPAALLGCVLSLAGIHLVRQYEYASNLLVAAVVVAAYGVAAAVSPGGAPSFVGAQGQPGGLGAGLAGVPGQPVHGADGGDGLLDAVRGLILGAQRGGVFGQGVAGGG
ncbi:hypothetical protein [Herbidospora yilanensis]|uniref:hypothetical protein n=1 Tax=Herbidospora yilanensis TaxID=354426 RepID=UPI0012F77CE7|nr:hypothetical protein [Herbidospora yilanensis]